MSGFNTTNDRLQRNAPQLRPAGVQGDYQSAGVADLTSSYNPNGVVTPTHIKAHQHRGPEVGVSSRHWGKANDPPADPNVVYGRKEGSDGNIDHCLRPEDYVDRATAKTDEVKEKSYKSHQQRPLGHGPAPAYPVPIPHEGFGVPTAKGESAMETMNAMRDVDVIHPPGQQKTRNYDWERHGVNPTEQRFGIQSNKGQSAQEALATSGETELIPRIMKDYNTISKAEVGKPKPYGFDDPSQWDANTVRRKKVPEESVETVLTSWSVDPHHQSGDDVALDTTGSARQRRLQQRKEEDFRHISSRFTAPEGNATYGVDSSGRTIITEEIMGDEATAPQLVNPSRYVELGVQSKYFAGGRDLESIRALCEKCGFGMTNAQIDEVFNATAKNGLCGIEQFKNAATARGYI